ncbi:MAG TPA: hypothetical protein VEF76_00785 [Patescibacteria group bacterium]|nr:hypothetical protein [Patescibacteria group bacterium]
MNTTAIERAFHAKAVKLAGLSFIYIQSMFLLHKGLRLDRLVSDRFFDFTCGGTNMRACWMLDKSDKSLTFLLHDLPVDIFTAIAVIFVFIFIASFRYPQVMKYRQISLLVVFGLIVVPGIVTMLKATTGHFCPAQLAAYGGAVGLQEPVPFRPRCYPAGFPSAGFSLLVLYFGAVPKFWRHFGLYAGLGIGGISSMIQIARGEHYLSHCLATLITALFVGMIVHFFQEHKAKPHQCDCSRLKTIR